MTNLITHRKRMEGFPEVGVFVELEESPGLQAIENLLGNVHLFLSRIGLLVLQGITLNDTTKVATSFVLNAPLILTAENVLRLGIGNSLEFRSHVGIDRRQTVRGGDTFLHGE